MGLYNVNPIVDLPNLHGNVENIIPQFFGSLRRSFKTLDSFVKVRQHSGEQNAIFSRGIYIQMS